MIQAPDLPIWAAILTTFCVLLGAVVTAIGSFGLLRLRTFYQRVHAPTLGATLGTTSIALGSIICFTVLQSRPVIHEVLIMVAVTLTTPVTLVLLGRAAIYRDRIEGREGVPGNKSTGA